MLVNMGIIKDNMTSKREKSLLSNSSGNRIQGKWVMLKYNWKVHIDPLTSLLRQYSLISVENTEQWFRPTFLTLLHLCPGSKVTNGAHHVWNAPFSEGIQNYFFPLKFVHVLQSEVCVLQKMRETLFLQLVWSDIKWMLAQAFLNHIKNNFNAKA